MIITTYNYYFSKIHFTISLPILKELNRFGNLVETNHFGFIKYFGK